MINIASAVEHSDETIRACEFGMRMGGVRSRVEKARQESSLSSGALEAKQAQLRELQRELRAIEARGEQDTFDSGAAPSEVRQFRENKERVAALTKEGREAAVALAEAKASGTVPAEAIARLAEKRAAAEKEVANLNGILMRQMSIKGFYLGPARGYVQRTNQMRALQQELALS